MISFRVDPSHGNNLTSFKVDGQELIYCDQKLLKNNDFTGCFIMFPFPNRVRNREFIFNGRKYSLAKVKVPRGNYPLIHGLVRDLKWKDNAVELNFPWSCRLSVRYKAKKTGLCVDYAVKNLDKTELGFGFGVHPYWKDAVAIKVPAKWVMEADKELLPTGKLLAADLNQLTPVSELDLDHVFYGLRPWTEVVFKNGLKLIIKTSADFTHCVVYTGEKDKFVCVEPQTCSTDAHNLDNLGFKKEAHLIRLKPGQTHRGWIDYEVKRAKN